MPKAHKTNTEIWTSLVETGVAILTVQHTPSNLHTRWLSRNQTTAQRTRIYSHTDRVLLNFSKALLIWQCSNISFLLRCVRTSSSQNSGDSTRKQSMINYCFGFFFLCIWITLILNSSMHSLGVSSLWLQAGAIIWLSQFSKAFLVFKSNKLALWSSTSMKS